ncbi:prolyl aminopeptidase [Aureimonas leprariae]|uniref:Proline iminopeptidase n=1 Tax=Plantimonas leprariae TaxID=2615207 RepID=A0A7V7PPY7_9HYPH|nr:prolyl aminopeptidase [Aureimonas leprariae]KAB0680111.1 prolyl aminopeptidase [Aureimonas leprariae]
MNGAKPYPAIEPYRTGRLAVGDGHELYWELCGDPRGRPAVFLHGGPGSGSAPHHRRLFDPKRYNVLLFDQRGAGRSTPLGGLQANTTEHLVADIERLREMVGAERWLVFGGSWGATLALAYAETYPERVDALVLRGVFTGRRTEIDWFYRGGANLMFPDHWADFLQPLGEADRGDPVAAYNRLLADPDPAIRQRAAAAWSGWERRLVTLRGGPAGRVGTAGPTTAAFAAIENHYVHNALFLAEGQLLANAGRLAGIPGTIVQGRWDVVTPAATSHALAKAWPEADYRVVESAGHAFTEAGIVEELVAATDRFADSNRREPS